MPKKKFRFSNKETNRMLVHKDLTKALERIRQNLISQEPNEKNKKKITKVYAAKYASKYLGGLLE